MLATVSRLGMELKTDSVGRQVVEAMPLTDRASNMLDQADRLNIMEKVEPRPRLESFSVSKKGLKISGRFKS